MPNINKNIIMQAGAAVANATNKAAGLSASTPEPGAIISAIQLVNGGRTIGPAALAHFTESVRNKLLSLVVDLEPIQSGSGTPSPDNVRPISGRTGLNLYVSPTQDVADATTYAIDWTSEAGTVYQGTVDLVSGQLTINNIVKVLNGNESFLGTYWPTVVCNTALSYIGDYDLRGEMRCSHCGIGSYGAGFASPTADKLQFRHADEVFGVNNATEFATYVATQYANGTPITVYYPIATPLTYQLTPQDIITLVGDNYIWSDSGDVTITE